MFGRSFGLKTVYCSMLMSLSIYALERLVPMDAPLTTQPMLELVFSVLLPAVGSAILFNLQGSTGGTDIVAMIFRKYTDLDIGKALFCTDFLIATLAGVVFGIETGSSPCWAAGQGARSSDSVIANIQPVQVLHHRHHKAGAHHALHQRGAEPLGHGAHGRGRLRLQEGRKVLLTVLGRGQAVRLRAFLREVDPQAFVVITNTSEIIGKGFRQTL